jgi:primosomal protein N' (replication factor Y)
MSLRYVEVAVQLPVSGTFHYSMPPLAAPRVAVGSRVLVPFGNRGVSGVVVSVSDDCPGELERVKDIDALVDAEPLLSEELVSLCMWVASYYEAPPGEVFKAALPVGATVSGAQRLLLTDAGRAALSGEGGAMTRQGREILARIGPGEGVAQKQLIKGRIRTADIDALVEQGLVERHRQFARQRVNERRLRCVTLTASRERAEELLARSPKRLAVVVALEEMGGEALVEDLRAQIPRASDHLRSLAKLGLVEIGHRVVRGDAWTNLSDAIDGMTAPVTPPQLNSAQESALSQIIAGLRSTTFGSYLLHGITGSGKTEVYLHAAQEVAERGQGAIILVPEISLTPQLAARFRARFGDGVAVLHSGLTDRERYDEWYRIREGQSKIALGARSAIFAPVHDLALVIVDEEHDSSFKQEEGVRYHARDVALVRAQRVGGVCVLGSATPSLESYYGAETGRHQLLELPERATPKPLPTVELVDLKVYRADSESMMSAPLTEAVKETLEAGEQVILFLNRRGFNTFVLCTSCGHSFRCSHCSVSLTYHRYSEQLQCHHCGFSQRQPAACPGCGAKESIERRGLGTERVADAIIESFSGARVLRLDRDVGSGRKVQQILGKFARGEADILVGTQMVTKGHDFPRVTLVGVLSADTALNLPDFRAGGLDGC